MKIDQRYLDQSWHYRYAARQIACILNADLSLSELSAIRGSTRRESVRKRIQQRIDAMMSDSWPLGPYHDELWLDRRDQLAALRDATLTEADIRQALADTDRQQVRAYLLSRAERDKRVDESAKVPIYGGKFRLEPEMVALVEADTSGSHYQSRHRLIVACIEAVCEYAMAHGTDTWTAIRAIRNTSPGESSTPDTVVEEIEDTRIEYDGEWDQ